MKRNVLSGLMVGVVLLGAGLGFAEEQVTGAGKTGFFRVMAGVGSSTASPADEWSKSYWTGSFGLGYEGGWGLFGYEFDLMYMTKGSRYGWEGNDWNDPFEVRDTFRVASLAALGKIAFLRRPSVFLLAGTAFGAVLSGRYVYESGSYSSDFDYDLENSRADWNIVFGAGAGASEGRPGIFAELRYYLGMMKIEGAKYNQLLILAGYRF